jgi:hypothetical protein
MYIDILWNVLCKVARAILENPKDKTQITLLYANVGFEDILLKVSGSTMHQILIGSLKEKPMI